MMRPTVPVLCWGRSWSKSADQPQDFLEQFLWHGDLGHLECDVPGMRDDLGADLDEPFPQAGGDPASRWESGELLLGSRVINPQLER